MSLDENLKVARRVALEVRENVPNSSNYAWTSSPVQGTGSLAPQPILTQITSAITSTLFGSQSSGTPTGVHEASNSALSSLRSSLSSQRPDDYASWLKSFESIKSACYSAKVGNCGELAAIACLLLRRERLTMVNPTPVEYVQIWDNVTSNPVLPHLVAVIGRNPNQLTCSRLPLGLPNQWHPDAVVCDPWDRAFYAAKEYNMYWDGLRAVSDNPQALTCTLMCQV
jgi:hypothetical protein